MNKQKIYLTQQIHSVHLKNLFRKNVMRLLARVPFSLGSICKYWIYAIDDTGLFTVLLLTIFEKRSIMDVWQGSEYASGWYIEIDRSSKCVLLWKPSVFIFLTIIQNQTKTVSHNIFEKFINNNSRHETQKVSWWVFWVRDARIFTRAFYIKIIIGAWSCL